MRKKGVILALAALACTFVGAATACKDKNSDFTGFKEGSATTIMIGETLRLDEFIDVAEDQEYTLIASNGVEEVDLTGRPTWYPDVKGKWTLTLKITSGKNKGTYTMEIEVDIPYSKLAYKTTPLSYPSGSTLSFSKLLNDLMVDVSSLGEYTLRVYNVRIGKNIMIEFDETDTEYTFDSLDTHYFTFGVETEKGEILKAIATVNVQEADVAAVNFCQSNGIEMFGYRQLWYRNGELSAEMSAGSYTGYFDNAELPYIAFKGNYTTNSYVTVDFTGKNIPQTAFFCDVISKNLNDKNQGIYVSHGTVTTDGGEKLTGDHSCLTYFGPNKMKDKHVNTGGSFGREGWMSTPHPASRVGLQDDTKYRYIVGYSNAVAGTENASGKRGSITLNMLLINLDTNEVVVDMTTTLSGNEQTGILKEEHFDGSIVLYANYGVLTKWDNIQLVQQDVADIHDLYPTASFKSNAPDYAVKGDTLTPTQFVSTDMLSEGQLFVSHKASQTAAEGALTPFGNELQINKDGVYRITYVPDDASVNPRSMAVYTTNDTNLNFENGVYGILRDGYRAGVTLFDKKNVTALQQAELDKSSTLKLEAISGDKSVRLRVGQIFGDMYSTFGVDNDYLAKVFEGTSAENVVFKMRSDYSMGMDYLKATYNSSGAITGSTWLQSGVKLVAGRDIFVTISRDDYEASRLGYPQHSNGLDSSVYGFRFLAPKTTAISMFNVMIDDFNVGTKTDGGTFIYKDGVNLSYTFAGTVDELYVGGKHYVKGADGCKVTFNGNTVTIPSSEIKEFTGQEIQIVGVSENGMEIVDCAIADSLSTTVLSYGSNDTRNSETILTYNVAGTIESVKVGDDSLADYYYHEGGVLYIAKEGLAKYAGQEGKVLSIKLAGGASLEIALNITAMQLPNFETANEILPFKTENIGKCEIVDVSDKKVASGSSGNYTYTTNATGKAYKMELPILANGGAHKLIFPFEVLEEVFSQPGVDAIHFNVHLSKGASGVYASDGFSTVEFAKGFHSRAMINRTQYEALAVNRTDHVFSIDSAWHKDSVEYLYIDNIRMTCNWSTTQEATFTKSEAAQGNAFVYGFFGNVTNVSFQKSGASAYADVTDDFELQGDVIILKAAKAEDTKYALGSLKIKTDAGVEYLVRFQIKA